MPRRSPRPLVRRRPAPWGRPPSWGAYLAAVVIVAFLAALTTGPTGRGAGQDMGLPASSTGGDLISRVAAQETRVAVLESLVGRPATVAVSPAGGQPTAVPVASLTLVGYDIGWRFGDQDNATTPITLTAAPGAVITLPNEGNGPHSFAVDALGIDVDMPVGQTVEATIPADAPAGEYEFYCNVPGHKALMKGTLVIGLRASDAQETGAPPAGPAAVVGLAPATPAAATPVATAGSMTFTGTGQTAPPPFDLPGGLYKFSGTCEGGYFAVDMVPVFGTEYVSVGLSGGAPYSGSDYVSVDGGRYAVSVTCQGAWSLTMEPAEGAQAQSRSALPGKPCWAEAARVVTGEADAQKRYTEPPERQIDPVRRYAATLETSKGTVEAELYSRDAPLAVNNFVCLARDGYFDGTPFHRIVLGFVVQGGDPTETSTGGPGYRFADEPVTREYEKGTLAMANAGPNTNGSQFFIVLADLRNQLPKNYTVFGKVTGGMEAVDALAAVPTRRGPGGERSQPTEPVTLERVTIREG